MLNSGKNKYNILFKISDYICESISIHPSLPVSIFFLQKCPEKDIYVDRIEKKTDGSQIGLGGWGEKGEGFKTCKLVVTT